MWTLVQWFGASVPMIASFLINWGCNPFLEWVAWFINKSMQLIQNNIASDIAALTLTLSVKGSLQRPNSPDGRKVVLIPTLLSPIYLLLRNATSTIPTTVPISRHLQNSEDCLEQKKIVLTKSLTVFSQEMIFTFFPLIIIYLHTKHTTFGGRRQVPPTSRLVHL